MGSSKNQQKHRRSRLYKFGRSRKTTAHSGKQYSVEMVGATKLIFRSVTHQCDFDTKVTSLSVRSTHSANSPRAHQYYKKKTATHTLTSNLEGCRIINLDQLAKHVHTLTLHAATCDGCRQKAQSNEEAIKLHGEVSREGLASLLCASCCGCNKQWQLGTSAKVKGPTGNKRWEVNLSAVWGQMATGGGAQPMNQFLSTIGIPGLPPSTFTMIEEQIGLWWKVILEEDMIKAGQEEKAIAEREGRYFQGVPSVTVIADGGWSKRSHKHSYVAYSGVGIVIGQRTGKILGIGVRNKYCSTCSLALSQGRVSPPHMCYRNWNLSSPAMEPDIILELFLEGERLHGVRYMTLVGDGDSSVLHTLHTSIPNWGPHIQKIECSNHVCKNIRSSLENLVKTKPEYKGRGRLSQNNRTRISVGIRCAIKMRSSDPDKLQAARKLEHDILNAARHVFGFHDNCSPDFCKHRQAVPSPTLDNADNNMHSNPSRNSAEIYQTNCQTGPVPFPGTYGEGTSTSRQLIGDGSGEGTSRQEIGEVNRQCRQMIGEIRRQGIGEDTGEGTSRQKIGEDTGEGTSRQKIGEDTGEGTSRQEIGEDTGEGTSRQKIGEDTGEGTSRQEIDEDTGDDLIHFLDEQQAILHDCERELTDTDLQQALFQSEEIAENKDPVFETMLADILVILSRYAGKAARLIENCTTNLAECYMSVRAKLDGGKQTFRSGKGSFNHRSTGAALRMNCGPMWSPMVWHKTFSCTPNSVFTGEYMKRDHQNEYNKLRSKDPEVRQKRKSTKLSRNKESLSSHSVASYSQTGEQCPLDIPDVSEASLETLKTTYYNTNVKVTPQRALEIEIQTRQQSNSGVWIHERHCRLTASNFGTILGLRKSTCVHPTLKSILYSKFHGNVHTKYGLEQEAHTSADYIRYMSSMHNIDVSLHSAGLFISLQDNFLAASPDALVTDKTINEVGVAEFKNLSSLKDLTVWEAFIKKETSKKWGNFCLRRESKNSSKLVLHKKHHYYSQVQGLRHITGKPWVDFVVRAKDVHVQRIYPDNDFWQNMRCKLVDFYYNCILPELASPRYPAKMRDSAGWVCFSD